jgi:hypothetical protein
MLDCHRNNQQAANYCYDNLDLATFRPASLIAGLDRVPRKIKPPGRTACPLPAVDPSPEPVAMRPLHP